jgi:hypothetical protein
VHVPEDNVLNGTWKKYYHRPGCVYDRKQNGDAPWLVVNVLGLAHLRRWWMTESEGAAPLPVPRGVSWAQRAFLEIRTGTPKLL